TWPAWFENNKTVIPKEALDGLNLIWHSDLVVSGGGTMNREAAALGVPVYSIFRGTIGAVDQYLARAGRLILLDSEESVWKKIKLVRREKTTSSKQANGLALQSIVEQVFTLDRELRSGGVSSKNST